MLFPRVRHPARLPPRRPPPAAASLKSCRTAFHPADNSFTGPTPPNDLISCPLLRWSRFLGLRETANMCPSRSTPRPACAHCARALRTRHPSGGIRSACGVAHPYYRSNCAHMLAGYGIGRHEKALSHSAAVSGVFARASSTLALAL